MNTQLIIGYVGGDPRITDFNDGGKVAQFTIGVTKKGYTTKDGRQVPDHTEWFNVVARNAQAKVVEGYVHKGERLFVSGETKTRQYRRTIRANRPTNQPDSHRARIARHRRPVKFQRRPPVLISRETKCRLTQNYMTPTATTSSAH